MNKDSIVKHILDTGSSSVLFCGIEGTSEKNIEFGIHPKEYPMFEMNNIIEPEDDGSVLYRYNSYGLRSDELSNEVAQGKRRFVFAGCSEGEGIGGNIEDSWTGITYEAIKDKLNLDGFYNLSVDNFGFQKIIMSCLLYVKEFGKPDAFVILFPDVSRVFKWIDKDSQYTIAWENVNQLEVLENRQLFMDSLINFIFYMNMFEEYCRVNHIKLFWSTWSTTENHVLADIKIFNHFIKFDYDPEGFMYSEDEVIKRDGHQGLNAHKVWSINMIDAIINYEKNA